MRARQLLCAVILVAACGGEPVDSPAEPAATVEARSGREFRLRLGAIARLDGDLLVAFRGVPSDSRCPIDAVCVWQGDAEVQLDVAVGRGNWTRLTLHTGVEPHEAVFNGRTIRLIAVEPANRASEPTDPTTYVVRLRVD